MKLFIALQKSNTSKRYDLTLFQETNEILFFFLFQQVVFMLIQIQINWTDIVLSIENFAF